MALHFKRWAACLAAAALAALLALGAAAEEGAEAARLPLQASRSDGGSAASLTDGKRGTKVTAGEGGLSVTVSSAQPFTGLYVVFDRPVQWMLTTGSTTVARGRDGFIHEYVPLASPACEATLRLPAGAVLCEVYAFGAGRLPGWVQVWQPPYDKADLLVLPTHADDEHLWFGGTMPYYAGELGKKVQVAYMTNHWGEPYRPHELLDGLWTVGVTAYPVISDYADLYASKESLEAARQVYGEDVITGWQVALLRRFKPDVVVAHDLNGEYGHGAHKLNAQTLLAALPLAADEASWPDSAAQYGVWATPKVYLHLWPENTITMEWGEMPLAAFGGRTALEMAEAGFACHASQTAYFSVNASGKYDCRQFGLAHTLVGPDVAKNDFFENIPSPTPQPSPSPAPTARPSPAPTPAPTPQPGLLGGGGGLLAGLAALLALAAALAVLAAALVRARRR